MRRSIVYFSVAGIIASLAIATAAVLNVCEPGPSCLYVPQLSNASEAARGTATAKVSPTQIATLVGTPAGTPTGTSAGTPVVTAAATSVATQAPTATPNRNAITIKGLAILGDSTQDEYQADNPRGGSYTAVTLNWVEQLVRYRGVNVGPVGTWGEPRRSGYEFNWARSGAGAADMIKSGQHTGAAAQIRAGKVSHVAIQIGINDFYFSGLGVDIYANKIDEQSKTARLNYLIDNIAQATRTVHAANPKGVLLVAMQDYLTIPILPELQTTFQDPVGRKRVLDAFAYVNAGLQRVAAEEGIPYLDYNAEMMTELNARRDSAGFIVVGGERIDLSKRGEEPHFGILDDGYAHPGTVLSGLSANIYIRAFNANFGTNITPFSDAEILRAAGIKS